MNKHLIPDQQNKYNVLNSKLNINISYLYIFNEINMKIIYPRFPPPRSPFNPYIVVFIIFYSHITEIKK